MLSSAGEVQIEEIQERCDLGTGFRVIADGYSPLTVVDAADHLARNTIGLVRGPDLFRQGDVFEQVRVTRHLFPPWLLA